MTQKKLGESDVKDMIESIRREPPRFHADNNDQLISYSISFSVMEKLLEYLRPEMNTLETGCGLSTVMFALAGCQHCCVTPRAAEAERVAAYCDKLRIRRDRLSFAIGRSERTLPQMFDDPPLQFAFIDGGHRFPYPVLDFFYVQHRVPVGGIVAVDDIDIPSVRIVYDFLSAETEWKRINKVDRTAFFERVEQSVEGGWAAQRFNQGAAWQRSLKGLSMRRLAQTIRSRLYKR